MKPFFRGPRDQAVSPSLLTLSQLHPEILARKRVVLGNVMIFHGTPVRPAVARVGAQFCCPAEVRQPRSLGLVPKFCCTGGVRPAEAARVGTQVLLHDRLGYWAARLTPWRTHTGNEISTWNSNSLGLISAHSLRSKSSDSLSKLPFHSLKIITIFSAVAEGEKMKAVVITTTGGPEVLQLQEVEDPQVKDDEVLIKIEAAAINRADTLQRMGLHPPPKGTPPYPGLECSGIVEQVGKNVTRWKVGDQVCALLHGGGYAEKVAVAEAQVLPIPAGISLKDAASFPEVACTVWSTVFMMSHLSAGETFLIHGGSSGIGTFAIQIAKFYGIRVFVTAGSEEKLAFCKDLGADVCINYKTEDFVARVKEETGGKGVDVILDNMGGPYFQRNLDSLNFDGRLCIIGLQGGPMAQIKLSSLIARRLTVQAAGLRVRTPENKAIIVSEVEKNVWPAIAEGKVKPVVFKHFHLSEAADAHQLLESSQHIGKILLLP
ncbi:hypothetical protein Nepgr_007243 [Nepenthes gracilis]|uniref:Enoyl reductase (ER) domain-containing protein n=1 Tax=Nepenthes gracilis TaxID=150966 RepID=A0AAD3S6G6_NEPGR|nr:hypothetical protein Nepgr_007243 [Nepenthes gracilis]